MTIKIAFLDVFHGDCTVVTFNEPHKKACIVIDGGEKKEAANRLAAYLKSENIEAIDLMIASHIDADHINGFIHLLKSYSHRPNSWNKGNKKCIHHYWGPKPDPNWVKPPKISPQSQASRGPSQRTTLNYVAQSVKQNQDLNKLIEKHITSSANIHFPSLQEKPPMNLFQNIKLELLAPDMQIMDSEIQKKSMTISNAPYKLKWFHSQSKPSPGPLTLKELRHILDFNAEEMAVIANRTANNQSLVVKVTPKARPARKWSFLLSGDAEHESWDMMLNNSAQKRKLPSKVLKVPHHGSNNGINLNSFRKINPEYNVVSVGQKHGLPDGPTLNLIKQRRNVKLFCTERNNSSKKPGACVNINSCIRKTDPDFRSLRFAINSNTGDTKIETFVINTQRNRTEIKNEVMWCPIMNWPH